VILGGEPLVSHTGGGAAGRLPFRERRRAEPDLARHAALAAEHHSHRPPRLSAAAAYESKRLRLRILAVAGRIVRTARRLLKAGPAWW
jgi:hypothetical protein